jgi:DNA invertase Pin-like site-specific DNA recombinase
LESLNKEKRRTVCYLRVSTQDQATGMESQERVLRQYCEQNGLRDVEFYKDFGISGTKSTRPALDKMMAAVESHEIETVIVYSFSRFARSTTHLLSALTRFKATGTSFVSITERIDTNSAVGVAIFSILASISQLERDLIADRVKIGLANARAKGKLIGRKKMRDSDLIRKLLKSGVSYRQISLIAKCSHGSVSAERAALKREEAALKQKIADQEKAAQELEEIASRFPEIPKPTTTDSVIS